MPEPDQGVPRRKVADTRQILVYPLELLVKSKRDLGVLGVVVPSLLCHVVKVAQAATHIIRGGDALDEEKKHNAGPADFLERHRGHFLCRLHPA